MSDQPQTVTPPRIGLRAALRALLIVAALPLLLFAFAGTWRWWQAWVYYGSSLLLTIASRALVAVHFPDLIAERANSLEHQEAKPWDRVLVPIVTVFGPLVEWAVAGLDKRFGWSAPVPTAVWWAALAVLVASWALATWALLTNRWFSGTVRIQTERGHRVVDNGPYRYVRHPGYTGAILGNLSSMLVLASWWALIPATLVTACTVLRTLLEDRSLQAELPGYIEYTKNTRYRLLPGVW
jgi:protein-S-isoprenylcysteine O-methyltransferase Ste14